MDTNMQMVSHWAMPRQAPWQPVGPPRQEQAAEWLTATTLQGVAVTGIGQLREGDVSRPRDPKYCLLCQCHAQRMPMPLGVAS